VKILIVGHFGGRNIGDEIILLSQMQILINEFPDSKFIIYTYDEEFTLNTYIKYNFKIETIKAFGLRNSISSTIDQLKKIKNIDFAILGGGGIMQDTYFSYGIFRYLLPIYICLIRNIPFYTYAIGVNKFNYNLNKSLFNTVLKYSNGISVRDYSSYENIKNLNSNFLIDEILDSALLFETKNLKNESSEDKTLILLFREFFEPYLDNIAILIKKLEDKYKFKKINLIVFENNEIEIKLANKMKDMISSQFQITIHNDINPINYLNLLNESSIVLTGRLHGLLPSVLLEKDLVCLSYAPKIESFCNIKSIPYLKFNDLKYISNINIDDYIFKPSKINIIDKKSLENSNIFLNKIKTSFMNKVKINFTNKIFISIKLFSYASLLICIHVANKLSNKKVNQE
jgi:polysaccharide pyruvyl transferase WcaK-like protein